MTALSETKRYQAYPEYKDSGVEWLGQIPAGWNLSKIAWHFRAEKGKNGQLLTKEYCGLNVGEHPVYSGQTENGGVMGKINSFEFDTGFEGVLFSTTVGAKAMTLSHLRGKFSLSQNCMIIASQDKNIVTRFAYYHFQPLFAYERGLIPEHMQASFRMEDLYRYPIATPSVEEQTEIANFLDHETAKIDTLIEKQQQLIKLLKEKRQAVISHAVTKGLNPQAPMKDSGVEWLGEVPEHWKLTLFKYLVSQMGGGTPDKGNISFWNGDIPWVSPKDMKVDYISTSQDFITDAAVKNSSTKLVPEQSILMVVRGMILIHSVPVALTTKPVTINQDMKALIPNKDIQPEFLLFFLKGIKDYILDFVETSAHGTKCLRTEDFENMQLFIPPIDEQVAILSSIKTSLDKLDSLIQKAEQAITLMSERRTALISAAVTGKIDVRNWQAPTSQNQSA
ncbi:restriction endonuclease subunit S [Vibrio parahaemolyticus]|nr:restriction endonuclease subunit S [Vibrio parahaemolyticus]